MCFFIPIWVPVDVRLLHEFTTSKFYRPLFLSLPLFWQDRKVRSLAELNGLQEVGRERKDFMLAAEYVEHRLKNQSTGEAPERNSRGNH